MYRTSYITLYLLHYIVRRSPCYFLTVTCHVQHVKASWYTNELPLSLGTLSFKFVAFPIADNEPKSYHCYNIEQVCS